MAKSTSGSGEPSSGDGDAPIPMYKVVVVVAIYLLRTGLMNCTYPLEESILMDFVPKETRARWKSLDSISQFGWCGSAALGAGEFTVERRLRLRGGELSSGDFEADALVLGLHATSESLLGEGGAGVELEPHLFGGLARLGEHAKRPVQADGVALGGLVLVAAVPRRQQVDEPQEHGDEDDHTTAEDLLTHAANGTVRGRADAASGPRV